MTRPDGAPRRRLRWIQLAPVLAFVALAAWAFASPIGAAPDDDYHLASDWCAVGGSEHCSPGSTPETREVSAAFGDIACYSFEPEDSAACQSAVLERWNGDLTESARGNFAGTYPPVYYSVMRAFAGPDLLVSALVMRLVNAALFVILATAIAVLLPAARRQTLLWGWLATLVPLGMFIIPSNNPSGWAVTGVGTAFLALLGWFESTGARRWGLAALAIIGVLVAAGARADAAAYAIGAMVTATIFGAPRWDRLRRGWWRWAWLPALGTLLAAVLFATAAQAGIAESGFSGSSSLRPEGGTPTGFALAAYNLLMLPFLWTGVWGTWALGWLDTSLPAIVPWAAASVFIVLAFRGIGRLDWRKAVSVAGVLMVLIVLPLWVLTRAGHVVGEALQPRYLLPLIVLFAFVLLTMPAGASLRFTRMQTFLLLGALAVADLVALQVNIRRYVTGVDAQGLNLDAGAEWWWTGLPVGPTAVWVIGVLAYAGLLAVLWPVLRRAGRIAAAPAASASAGEPSGAPLP